MKHLIISIIVCFVNYGLIAQNQIIDHLSQDEKFTIILDLLEVTELDELLIGNEYYTLIAPDNDAFLSHFTIDQLDSLKQDGLDELTKLLMHHIIPDVVDVDDSNAKNVPLYGDLIRFFLDSNSLYHITSNTTSTEMFTTVEVDNGRILEAFNGILINRNDSLKENDNLRYYWHHFFAENTLGLDEDISVLDTILNSTDDITIIGLLDLIAVREYIDQNGALDKEQFVDSLIRRHTLSGLYSFQNIYDGLVVKNWLNEDVEFRMIDDTCFVNNTKIFTQYIYNDAAVFRLENPNDIIEPIIISSVKDEEVLVEEAIIFPNPSDHEFIISIPKNELIIDFKIFNLQGEIVFYENEIVGQKIIDTQNMNSGIYIISYNLNGKYLSKKLVKK